MNLDIFENLIDKVKENEFIQNFTKELEKNMENSMQKSMLEKFVSDNKIISEYKDKMLINRNMILQELNNNEMYYIYDKKGSDYLATICEKGKSHEIIRIPERDVKSNVKIDSVLRKTNDKFELDEETTRLVKNKMEEMFKKILEEGELFENRTGVDTLSIPGGGYVFDVGNEFPILESKKIMLKNALSELLWIYQG